MASMADVSTPFTTRMTEEQMGQYRKRKVALISGALYFCPHIPPRSPSARAGITGQDGSYL